MATVKVFVYAANADTDSDADADGRAMTLAPRTFVGIGRLVGFFFSFYH